MRKEAREPAGGFLEGSQAWMTGERVSPPPRRSRRHPVLPHHHCRWPKPPPPSRLPTFWLASSVFSCSKSSCWLCSFSCISAAGWPLLHSRGGASWLPRPLLAAMLSFKGRLALCGRRPKSKGKLEPVPPAAWGRGDEGAEGWPVQQYGAPGQIQRPPSHPSLQGDREASSSFSLANQAAVLSTDPELPRRDGRELEGLQCNSQ